MDLNFEENLGRGWYYKNDTEFGDSYDDDVIWNIRCRKKEEDRIYTYDEAIDLTGNGWYNIALLVAMALAMQAMMTDMFGFSYVVAAAACDLHLNHHHTSFLLTVPLIGVIVSSYPWGYFADTRGRKKSLTIALWGGFVLACLSAFSPNFTVLAVFKFFSSALCSGALPITYALLGECCGARTRPSYLLIVNSSLMVGLAVYTAHAYVVLGLDFTCDLGLIVFKPWRLLILSYATVLGCSAMLTQFFYESPKFLVNAGRTAEAVEILSHIKKWNRGCSNYSVKKIVLLEANTLLRKDVSFARSLWDQMAPLFKPPLLQRSLLLFYITASIYSVNNGLFLWIPILFESIFDESSTFSNNTVIIPPTNGFCGWVNSQPTHAETEDCSSVVNLKLLVTAIIQGLVFIVINFGASMVAHRKKALMFLIFVLSCFCCFGMVFVTEKLTTLVLFFGINLNSIGMSIVFAYFIELFPTRCRGMISCLGMMVGRASGLVGVTLIGTFTFTHCTTSLYVLAAYIFSGALMSLLLPPDIPEKSSRDSNYQFSL